MVRLLSVLFAFNVDMPLTFSYSTGLRGLLDQRSEKSVSNWYSDHRCILGLVWYYGVSRVLLLGLVEL
jgi:hypothetical protein